jgi:hypothetical protein
MICREFLFGPSGSPVPQPDGDVTVVASSASYLWAVALDMPIAAETSTADVGFSDTRNACSTSCLVEDAAMVAG